MNAYCPECETDLDQATGICPACRWDPNLSTNPRRVRSAQSELSLTERYRGTQWDQTLGSEMASPSHEGVSRGRLFVVAGLVAAGTVYGLMLSMAAPF